MLAGSTSTSTGTGNDKVSRLNFSTSVKKSIRIYSLPGYLINGVKKFAKSQGFKSDYRLLEEINISIHLFGTQKHLGVSLLYARVITISSFISYQSHLLKDNK